MCLNALKQLSRYGLKSAIILLFNKHLKPIFSYSYHSFTFVRSFKVFGSPPVFRASGLNTASFVVDPEEPMETLLTLNNARVHEFICYSLKFVLAISLKMLRV